MNPDTLFAPERVAVVGASEEEGSVGRAITENLLASFEGAVVPVNPNRESVLGERSFPDVGSAVDAVGPIDLAVVAVPASVAVDVLRAVGEAGIGSVVVVTAGFGETGGEGAARERQLREVAAEYDLDLVGPNSLGVLSTPSGLNATFAPRNAEPGNVSFMSQSGAFVTAVLDWAADRALGFRHVVSLGNKAVLDEGDFLEAWGADDGTDVVVGYLEDVADGASFVRTAREVTRETPVVLVKSGRTEAGASAAASHTGAIAGSEAAYRAAIEQAGIVRADTVEELFDAARALAGQRPPERDGVAVVTNAGGPGVMATDAVGDSGLSLASLSTETVGALRDRLPGAAAVHNPVDVIGDADEDRLRDALATVLADPGVGSAVVVACPTATMSFDGLADALVGIERDEPLAACLMGGSGARSASETLAAAGVPTSFDPARAVRSLDVLRSYREARDRPAAGPPDYDVDGDRARAILRDAADRGRSRLGVEAMDLLEAYGIPTPAGEVVDDPEEARRVARDIDGDVVMKIVSPDILHKSDIGGVRVGVADDEVADAYEDLVTRARNYQPDATLLGVQVQEQLDLSAGVECIAGLNRDPQFGPLVLFGLGGVFVEVLEDTTTRIAPVPESETRAMLDEIRAAPLLRGARGREPVDEPALAEAVARLSQLAADLPAVLELDVNPLVATPEGATAVDLRLTIDPDAL